MHARGFAGLLSRMQEQRKHEPTTEQLPRIDRAGARRLIASAGPDVGRDGGQQWGGAARSWFIKTSSWHAIVLYGAVLAGVMTASLEGPQHAWSSGGLLRSPPDSGAGGKEFTMMKKMSAVGVAAVVSVASSLCAAPPGYVIVADAQEQFSDVQGQSGWWYLFDRGEGTEVEQMPYFVPQSVFGRDVWCVSSLAGGADCYCFLGAGYIHPNSAQPCSGWTYGLLRPIRRWTPPIAVRWLVEVSIEVAPSSLAVELIADSHVVATYRSPEDSGSASGSTLRYETVSASPIEVRVEPRDGCHSDGRQISMRIYGVDCDTNGIADYFEIATNPSIDINHNSIPDTCECIGDIYVDRIIDGGDLGVLLAYWGSTTSAAASIACDLNVDGVVNGSDLGILLAYWGPCSK